MREMGEGRTEQTLDKTTEQLGVDSSLNTEEDTVEPSTNAEQPGDLKRSPVLGMVQTLGKC